MRKLQWFVVALTLIQVITSICFCVPGYEDVLTHPQHGYFEKFEELKNIISSNSSSLFWYRAFFINDILWIAALLWLLRNYLFRLGGDEVFHLDPNRRLLKVFYPMAAVTLIFDILENISYLTFQTSWIPGLSIEVIVVIKIMAFVFTLLVLVFGYYKAHLFDILGVLKSSVKASIISIIAIALLLGLATLMDQGSTVIIHLFDHPASLAGVFILINLLALVSGHYPDYINKYIQGSDQQSWQMHGLFGGNSNTGLGLITYTNSPSSVQGALQDDAVRQIDGINRSFFNHFRKIIGTMVMITWLYVLFFVVQKYMFSGVSPIALTSVITILVLVLHFKSSNSKQAWRTFVQDNISENQSVTDFISQAGATEDENLKIPTAVKFYTNTTLIAFLMLILFMGITVGVSFSAPWLTTWALVTITTIINIIFIILFQNFRTLINLPLVHKYLSWIPIRGLGHDIRHVRLYALSGFVTFGFYVATTFNPGATNALAIILMALFLYYGFIVVIIKHHVFYAAETNGSEFTYAKSIFKYVVPIMGVLFLVWILFNGKIGNGLHKIPVFHESADLIRLSTFKENLKTKPSNTKYLIASYGGGLRATTWTMLLLDTLEKTEKDFFSNTIAMSGVSGGFLGLSFYTSIFNEHENKADREASISSIGRHNMLSIDVSYLFGFDMLREMIPFVRRFRYKDRAGRSMTTYADLIQKDSPKKCNLLYSSFRSYWAETYQNAIENKSLFPALIANTTGTNSQYGVAFPMQYAESDFVFPGAIDILSITENEDSTISYLDATSTTERFPIFSPAADIEHKGNFLDGGYFENSGLLSLMNFYSYLEQDESFELKDENTKVIVFINSKEDYIRKVLPESIKPKNNKATSELGAILKTVTDISTLSLALENKYQIRFRDNYIPIYLPYPITYEDVKDFIGGVPNDPFEVQRILKTSNKKVTEALKPYGHHKNKPIPPALARVLSDPAFDYTKAMLNHEEVKEAIKRILEK